MASENDIVLMKTKSILHILAEFRHPDWIDCEFLRDLSYSLLQKGSEVALKLLNSNYTIDEHYLVFATFNEYVGLQH